MSDKDCLPCRLISGFGVMGAGYYVYHHGKSQTKGNRLILTGVSLVFGTVGLARLLNLYPFKKDEN